MASGLVTNRATGSPAPVPAIVTRIASRGTMRAMSPRLAPVVMRTPISRVRRATE
jgi:hypothetical protein